MEKTTEEKIDYIYNHIKTERKFIYGRRIFKFLTYLFFIAYFAYFYLYGFEKLKNSVIEAVKPNINSEKIVDSLKKNSGEIFEKLKNSKYLKNKDIKEEGEKVEENYEDIGY